ncbi:type II toxin-antitoxin system RelE/ParE family toxin [Crenothrix polyspora]|uniref:Type II toxin-antitoxin system RelE/ParE family toxin n=1 Tax=Crenothrix polyspora TaxID=360316 RepID=A0A1R4HGA5_9GAMM|nr:type II toxin-antitoxin system RelE/ParE family toxin [Crenothrix polyspora]SJM94900.1 conserved hypothetical protein [Crenothrix polyspora]
MKKAIFRGNSLTALRNFPPDAKQLAGFEIHRLQEGKLPRNYKPMNTIGQGVYEIRLAVSEGQYRILYVAKFAEAIYLLHAFPKKTQKTSATDIAAGQKAYQELMKELKP